MTNTKSVTLAKNGREVTLTIPRDIVEYRAAGWREKPAKQPSTAAQDDPAADDGKKTDSAKGGSKK